MLGVVACPFTHKFCSSHLQQPLGPAEPVCSPDVQRRNSSWWTEEVGSASASTMP